MKFWIMSDDGLVNVIGIFPFKTHHSAISSEYSINKVEQLKRIIEWVCCSTTQSSDTNSAFIQ